MASRVRRAIAFLGEVSGAWLVIAIVFSPLIPFAFVAAGVSMMNACGTAEGEHPKKASAPTPVDERRADLELLASGTENARQVSCRLAEPLDRAEPLLARIQEEHAALCDALSAAARHAALVMEPVRAGSKPPAKVYAFSILDGGAETEAGPFSTLADCEAAEARARAHRAATRRCAEWTPLTALLLDETKQGEAPPADPWKGYEDIRRRLDERYR